VTNSLNLASKPFNNRILPWALTAIVLFVSVIGLFLVVRLTTRANQDARTAEAEINTLKQREQGLLQAAQQMKNSFTPDQQQALPAAHELVDRKTFSWSGLLADLESSLPGNVRVSRIAVRDVTRQSNQTIAQLDLAVFAKNSSTISDMISAMHQEGIFEAELRNQNLQKGRGEAGTEYELFVIYRSRPGRAIESVAEVDGTRKAGGEVPR
jgi:Tfp pilus assembly protein PilN